jgi:hypothetical protein
MGNPFDPLGHVVLVAMSGGLDVDLDGPLEQVAPGCWIEPGGDESLMFNNRGVRIANRIGTIFQPWTVMAINKR